MFRKWHRCAYDFLLRLMRMLVDGLFETLASGSRITRTTAKISSPVTNVGIQEAANHPRLTVESAVQEGCLADVKSQAWLEGLINNVWRRLIKYHSNN